MADLPRVLVLTPLGKEFKAMTGLVKTKWEELVHPEGTVYEVGAFPPDAPNWELVLVETGRGGGRAGDETHRGIAFLKPRIVLMLGVAGGVKDVQCGDVVAATKVYDYESGKEAETPDGKPAFYPRPEIGESTYPLVQRARKEARDRRWIARIADEGVRTPSVFVEPIVTGGKVVAAKRNEAYERITNLYSDAVALDQESYDVLRVAYATGIDCLAVRGISDTLVGKAADDESGAQEIAARHAAAFALEVLERLDTDRYRTALTLDELGMQIVAPEQANPILEELGEGVDAYFYRGHLGRYPRTAVAGQLIKTALESGVGPNLFIQLILIDPADDRVMESYAAHRRTQGLDGGLKPSDAVQRVRHEVLATVLRMCLWRGMYPKLTVDIRFTKQISLIRIDLCDRLALFTRDNLVGPMIIFRPHSPFYKTFKDEVGLTAQFARRLVDGLPGITKDAVKPSGVSRLFTKLGVGLDVTSKDAGQILAMALSDDPPYGRPQLGRPL